MAKIVYTNKVTASTIAAAEINKITAANMNEIKTSVNVNVDDIAAEITDRENADTALQNNIDAEATDRENADVLKANIANPTFTGTVGGITKAMVGLGNADNTSDANKPVSTPQANALALKLDKLSVNTGAFNASDNVNPSSQKSTFDKINPLILSNTNKIDVETIKVSDLNTKVLDVEDIIVNTYDDTLAITTTTTMLVVALLADIKYTILTKSTNNLTQGLEYYKTQPSTTSIQVFPSNSDFVTGVSFDFTPTQNLNLTVRTRVSGVDLDILVSESSGKKSVVIDAVKQDLTDEVNRATSAEGVNATAIATEVTTRFNQVNAINEDLLTRATALVGVNLFNKNSPITTIPSTQTTGVDDIYAEINILRDCRTTGFNEATWGLIYSSSKSSSPRIYITETKNKVRISDVGTLSIIYFNVDNEIIGLVNNNQQATWFTNVSYIRFLYSTADESEVQIEFGETSTTYKDYNISVLPAQLNEFEKVIDNKRYFEIAKTTGSYFTEAGYIRDDGAPDSNVNFRHTKFIPFTENDTLQAVGTSGSTGFSDILFYNSSYVLISFIKVTSNQSSLYLYKELGDTPATTAYVILNAAITNYTSINLNLVSNLSGLVRHNWGGRIVTFFGDSITGFWTGETYNQGFGQKASAIMKSTSVIRAIGSTALTFSSENDGAAVTPDGFYLIRRSGYASDQSFEDALAALGYTNHVTNPTWVTYSNNPSAHTLPASSYFLLESTQASSQSRVNTIPVNSDIVSVMFGTNDTKTYDDNGVEKPLYDEIGSIDDYGDNSGSGGIKSFIGSFRQMINLIENRISQTEKFGGGRLVICIPPKKKFEFDTPFTGGRLVEGIAFDAFRDAIRLIGKVYGYEVIDFSLCINHRNLYKLTTDGVHPTLEIGIREMASFYANKASNIHVYF